MPKFEFRFDLASILLASVLTVLGISVANAGGKAGDQGGNMRSHASALHAGAAPSPAGGKGGSSGGDVRSRSGVVSATAASLSSVSGAGGSFRCGAGAESPSREGGKGGVNGGDVRSRQ